VNKNYQCFYRLPSLWIRPVEPML